MPCAQENYKDPLTITSPGIATLRTQNSSDAEGYKNIQRISLSVATQEIQNCRALKVSSKVGMENSS
jgi:hypothetical protein